MAVAGLLVIARIRCNPCRSTVHALMGDGRVGIAIKVDNAGCSETLHQMGYWRGVVDSLSTVFEHLSI